MTGDAIVRLRYRFVPDRIVGEILSKSWVDNAIPALAQFPASFRPGTSPICHDRSRNTGLSPSR
jgi:hypothetical protein